jgi:hypothetical protein
MANLCLGLADKKRLIKGSCVKMRLMRHSERFEMNTKMLTKARELFSVDYIPQEINRANQRKWIRSIRRLGDKWLLAKNIERKQNVIH